MTHEFKKIVASFEERRKQGKSAVLATVVALEGSSYRRPGVRMLIFDDFSTTGAVSGGCVEKEIARQAQAVFSSGIPRVMTYDGRYRLGCEGILYILIEPFEPSEELLAAFKITLRKRVDFEITSFFEKQHGDATKYGSTLIISGTSYPLRPGFEPLEGLQYFSQEYKPCFRLMILGAEHDAVQLCSLAALSGWEVVVVANPTEEKAISDFPGATELINIMPESLDTSEIDAQTAVVLMSHSYVKDLKYLLSLKDSKPAYLGLLGPSDRREKLLNEFLEYCPDLPDTFLDNMRGPAGINIGAESPQEIAIAIMAEILSVIRQQKPIPLREKKGRIHS